MAQETGTSKELIHHYLRQGLLPPSTERARYSDEHVRLLRQIRLLREDHNLPLDVIRRIFAAFAFDPGRIESLTLSESLCKRMTRFATEGALLSAEALSAEELAQAAGIPVEHLSRYIDGRLISPLTRGGEELFSAYDAHVVALCEHGTALGVPFESFRTIASYVRIAFELEHEEFFGTLPRREDDAAPLLAELFVRREVSTTFVENVLNSLLQRRFHELLAQAPRAEERLDDILFRPSDAFVVRHRIDARIDHARDRLAEAPERVGRWLDVAALLLHAGRYHEAVFFLEESLERWPADPALRVELGVASIWAGATAHGIELLAGADLDPRSRVFLALARVHQAAATRSPETLLRETPILGEDIQGALDATRDAPLMARAEIAMLAGWLLTVLPPQSAQERGRAILKETLDELERDRTASSEIPGWRERLLLNTAYLLFESLGRQPRRARAATDARADEPSHEHLRNLVCRLDPGCALARTVFLSEDRSIAFGR